MTKVFTALALARLTVAGTAELDEPLAALLPGGTSVPSRDGQEITLRHLATHTSGLPRPPKGMLLQALLRPSKPDPYAGRTTEFLLRGPAGIRLGATPGRRFRYSNLGAGLLGSAPAWSPRRSGSAAGSNTGSIPSPGRISAGWGSVCILGRAPTSGSGTTG
ncbi:serine hydrolase domain-containing protein [Streptosporangium roseum]|uniref:serine hydrolase domain-containing protein n=1 Tax=Streptosporangium roseum TaxID=2001 RepID=UPI0001A3EF25|nr:serine hydrolase [Streptosporangium roseum]